MTGGYTIIVHAAGQLDDETTVAYWTEVPALAACASDGATLDDAVANTQRSIARWLGRLVTPAPHSQDIPVRVERAY